MRDKVMYKLAEVNGHTTVFGKKNCKRDYKHNIHEAEAKFVR